MIVVIIVIISSHTNEEDGPRVDVVVGFTKFDEMVALAQLFQSIKLHLWSVNERAFALRYRYATYNVIIVQRN